VKQDIPKHHQHHRPATAPPPAGERVKRFFAELGPGLITGAADDDPSGISTYSVAGAAFGYAQLWLAVFTFPLMAAVQLMCARLGLVTGRGLAAVIRLRYPRWVLWSTCFCLVVANVVNIAADLGGMAAAMELLTGISAYVWVPFFAALIILLLLYSSYRHIAQIFKWLTLVLFAYVAAAFLARPAWAEVLRATLIPQLVWSPQYLATFIAVLGTTISPYLFFWQAAQEVEEERAQGRWTWHQRRGATTAELRAARDDVFTGMFFAGLVMYFIILTTGATLHQQGIREIDSARQAAEALRPLAGNGAYLLFTLGLVGTGMLGVPVLAGSAAYTLAEALHWRGSLNDRPRASAKFYAVLTVAVGLGWMLNWLEWNAVRMLYGAALVNGLLAPPLLWVIVLLTSDRAVMGPSTNPLWLRVLGGLTTVLMTLACLALVILWWRGSS